MRPIAFASVLAAGLLLPESAAFGDSTVLLQSSCDSAVPTVVELDGNTSALLEYLGYGSDDRGDAVGFGLAEIGYLGNSPTPIQLRGLFRSEYSGGVLPDGSNCFGSLSVQTADVFRGDGNATIADAELTIDVDGIVRTSIELIGYVDTTASAAYIAEVRAGGNVIASTDMQVVFDQDGNATILGSMPFSVTTDPMSSPGDVTFTVDGSGSIVIPGVPVGEDIEIFQGFAVGSAYDASGNVVIPASRVEFDAVDTLQMRFDSLDPGVTFALFVPEPSALWMTLIGGATLWSWRRSSRTRR